MKIRNAHLKAGFRPFGLFLTLTLIAFAGCGGGGGSVTPPPPPPPPTAAAPTFSPAGGTYAAAQTVTLSDATAGTTIYYTLDGSAPSVSSTKYTAAISIPADATIKAMAAASGYTSSTVSSAAYMIRIPGPVVSVVESSDDGKQTMAAQANAQFFTAPVGTNPVYIDETQIDQTIEGYGAAFTDTAAYNLNEVATSAAHTEAVNNLFTRTGKGIGLTFMRVPMGASDLALSVYSYDDQPAGQTDPTLADFSIAHDQTYIIPLILEAKGLNPAMKIMANPWSPPGWMKSNDSMINGGTLLPAAYTPFANYFVKFIQAYTQAGIPIDYLSMENEPENVASYPTMDFEAPEATMVLSQYLLPALTANNINTKVFLLDWNYDVISYPQTEMANATIADSSQIAGVAWHGYGGQQGAMQLMLNQYPSLGQYETEHSGGAWNADQFKTDFEDITAVMRNSGKSFVKWSLAVDQNYGPHTNGCGTCYGLVTINSITGALSYDADYYTLGHFSKYVYQGAQRIYSSNAKGILTSAYINPNGSRVLIAFNDSASSQSFQAQWGNQSLSYTLPSLEAATFTWNGTEAGTVTVSAKNQIQASSYNSLSSLMTESTSDTDGGYDLGYAADGSYAVYKNVNFGASVSELTARVAQSGAGASIEFHLDSLTGTLVGTIPVPNTGGWQTWSSVTVTASGTSGVHDLYVVYKSAPSNLNWFTFN